MRVPFRLTSGMVARALLLLIASHTIRLGPADHSQAETGGVSWDPCMMWIHYGMMHRLMS
jgi:hypothetical protein